MASVVFVGGSLVPVGGHDILQPLFHGKPTFFGPHMHNQRDLAELAMSAGAAGPVEDAMSLAEAVRTVLTDPERAAQLARGAAALLEANRGAADRCAQIIESALASSRLALGSTVAAESQAPTARSGSEAT
jgi:3-deoxy-D-manno-octulosonic-acid transferase